MAISNKQLVITNDMCNLYVALLALSAYLLVSGVHAARVSKPDIKNPVCSGNIHLHSISSSRVLSLHVFCLHIYHIKPLATIA